MNISTVCGVAEIHFCMLSKNEIVPGAGVSGAEFVRQRLEATMTTSEKLVQITQEPNYEKKLELVEELTGEEAKEILKAFIRFQNRSEQ